MDMVGHRGRGESVWLAWFTVLVIKMFAPLCPSDEQQRLLSHALNIEKAARSAWDGKWYLRGYFDDGSPLGSKESEECQIDAIAQGFAPLAGVCDENTKTALKSAFELLMRPDARAVALFTPPFEGKGVWPGYISSYPAGVRENGGQYTHGAVWLAMGCLRAGFKEEGLAILKTLAPKGEYDANYAAEPFVIAADVSLKKGSEGKAGWSWYTGSAGWFYRAVLEDLLGLTLQNGTVTWDVNRLPPGWNKDNVQIFVNGKQIEGEKWEVER